jgi:hypothetical protein
LKSSVDSFSEGESALKSGVIGFFSGKLGVLSTILITGTLAGTPWWWPEKLSIPSELVFSTKIFVIVIFLLIGCILTGGIFYLRHRSIRSLDTKALLHSLAHSLRDYQSGLFNSRAQGEEAILENFRNHVVDLCEYIKDYFVLMTYDKSINCAIRLAVEIDEPDGIQIVYKTYGRSSGLNQARAETTEDIPANRGIPRYLIEEKECKGVLRYNDLNEAMKNGIFQKTKNEEEYPEEIKTLFVAPMSAWDGKKRSMIGLMYITSRKKNVFKHKHVDCMRFVTDLSASSVAFGVQRIKNSINLKTIRRIK